MRTTMRALLLWAVAALAFVPAVRAEIWAKNDGTATTSSQTVTFPRAFSSMLVINDSATIDIHYRLFWCGETVAAATTAATFPILKAGTDLGKRYRFHPGTEITRLGNYCAITLITASSTAAFRLEGK